MFVNPFEKVVSSPKIPCLLSWIRLKHTTTILYAFGYLNTPASKRVIEGNMYKIFFSHSGKDAEWAILIQGELQGMKYSVFLFENNSQVVGLTTDDEVCTKVKENVLTLRAIASKFSSGL
jgi:hypothetical protein